MRLSMPIRSGLTACATLALLAGGALAQASFVDHRGKTITFDSPPERVVTIVRSAPILYRAVDGTADHVAGMNRDSLTRYFTSGLLAELLPEMADIPASAAQDGFVPNVEAILEQQPDAVIQWIYDPEIIEPLERVGLTVVGWDCCTEQHRLDYVTLTGYMTGRNDRAQQILGLQAEALDGLRDKLADVDAGAWPSVLHVDQLGDQIRVIANGSQDLSLSGVTNPAADDSNEWWRTIDLEQLLVWDPDMIVIPAYATELTPQDFLDDPVLGSLKAVAAGKVYKQPVFARTPDAPEIYLTSAWLAALAHGADFAPAFREAVTGAYGVIYGVDMSDAQVDAALETEANAGAAGYDALFGPAGE
ncbi:ABC transporter substrate-binding protein [Marinibacterium sp. SX1]|uniref:ABC transporter substrate-binding protein n=1 Tax=Marinibacterium sp. SX1 TaxID=3388424 RepID=UPI003D17DA7C